MTTAYTEPTTAEYMTYHAGFAAGQRECQTLPEQDIRIMHAALCKSLARPAVYPTGLTGPDRAHAEGRCHAFAYFLNGRTTGNSLLHDVRAGRDLFRRFYELMRDLDNHYQAGYDTGYYAEYQAKYSELHAEYVQVGEAADAAFHAIIRRYNLDEIDASRLWSIIQIGA